MQDVYLIINIVTMYIGVILFGAILIVLLLMIGKK
jgi:hypothetical protein